MKKIIYFFILFSSVLILSSCSDEEESSSEGSFSGFRKNFKEKIIKTLKIDTKTPAPKKAAGSVGLKKNKAVVKKLIEKKTEAPTSEKNIESAGPKKVEVMAKKPIEKKQESNQGNGTRGNYIGISGIRNQIIFHEEYTDNTTPETEFKPSATGYGYGIGLNYKYAVNFHDFFIAPGAFVEKNWLRQSGNDKVHDPAITAVAYSDISGLDIKSRVGITADLGYDFTNKFAAYFMGGYSLIQYRGKAGLVVTYSDSQTAFKNSTKGSAILGIGTKYNYSDHISLNIEANTQKFNLKNSLDVLDNRDYGYLSESKYRGRLNSIKIGASYNF